MQLKVIYVDEPHLEFRFGQKLAYPRDGLYLFGPLDARETRRQMSYGVISTQSGLARFERWAESVSQFIATPLRRKGAKEFEPHHVPFPGVAEAFHVHWSHKPDVSLTDIDEGELRRRMSIANRHEAIKSSVDLFVQRLVDEQSRNEAPPNFWYVVVPDFVHELGRPQSKIAKSASVASSISVSQKQAQRLNIQPTLFGIDEKEAEIYDYDKDFRRQLKARLLQHQVITQIVRESTLAPNDFLTTDGRPKRLIEDPATVAWKLCTGSYYKNGGRPWQIADMRPGVCYVGLVYKKQDDAVHQRFSVCAAQMFLSDGEGVVFRGALGPWFHPETKQFHLSEEAAANLVITVLNEYKRKHGHPPSELFIHAKSSFDVDEWRGFQQACQGGNTNLVGVQIVDAWDQLKLFRQGSYPVIRGTALIVDSRSGYLLTSGYVPRLATYMGPDTPNPLWIKVVRGDAAIETALRDVMALTKVNFNTCLFNDRMPVTIRFADAIGDILRAAPQSDNPMLPFKFYI